MSTENKRMKDHPVMNVGYFGALVVVVAPTMNGCSIAILERDAERFRFSDNTWSEDLCDRLSDSRSGEYMNALGVAHCIDGGLLCSESAAARQRTLVRARHLSLAINNREFDSALLRANDEQTVVSIIASYVLELFDNSGRLSEMSSVAKRSNESFHQSKELAHESEFPRFLSQH